MPDELILILDEFGDLELFLSAEDELVLEDSTPYAPILPEYEGPYVVTPILYGEQELETNNKKMIDNVVVTEIPIVQTTNPYGGYTVVIG